MTPNWRNRTMWTGDNLDIMRGIVLGETLRQEPWFS